MRPLGLPARRPSPFPVRPLTDWAMALQLNGPNTHGLSRMPPRCQGNASEENGDDNRHEVSADSLARDLRRQELDFDDDQYHESRTINEPGACAANALL